MINFHKYHGAGNDFILINGLEKSITLKPEEIKFFCDRNVGIGSDGLIIIEPSDKADCFMNYYNSDGTVAEMCGNGIRCVAKFFIEQTNSLLKKVNIDTQAGIKNVQINDDETCSVNMGNPIFTHGDFPSEIINLEGLDLGGVSMGNPHAVVVVDNLDNIDVKVMGPKIENDAKFPNKINVEFAQKINENYYKVKVWERGCGETLACGTGACAVYAILRKKNFEEDSSFNKEEITLEFPGGNLFLSENKEKEIILRGSAVFVFKGEI